MRARLTVAALLVGGRMLNDHALSLEPVLEVMSIFGTSRQVELVRALRDLIA
jgi:hypothetical protein